MADKKPPRFTVRIHLKSGRIIKFRARTFKLDTYPDGSVKGYKYDGAPILTWYFRHRRPFYFNPAEIAAVETTGV